MVTEQQVIDALKPIEDPELHLGIVDLGLIYEARILPADVGQSPDAQDVKVKMTFTSPFCPYGPALKMQVQQALGRLPGVTHAQVDIVFSPPWDPRTMASEECKIALGLGWEEEEPGAGGDGENQR
ncbi:MAG: metal-sulfur cluster assembly factor [Candidatus Omnitrophica bacterium]|nr:metal-sulfur cluster assembly factor [Candidatus Omnitrophota bacterium]